MKLYDDDLAGELLVPILFFGVPALLLLMGANFLVLRELFMLSCGDG